MDKKMLDRINELAKKKKEQGLTEAEQKEQKELYKIYLGEIRTQFNATLDLSLIHISEPTRPY